VDGQIHTDHLPMGWAAGWKIGVLGLYSRRGLGVFLFTTASRSALGPTRLPIQWVLGALSLEVKRPAPEADHSSLPNAELKNAFSCISTPPVRLHGVVLSKKAQGQLYLLHAYGILRSVCCGQHRTGNTISEDFHC
jgi:hypothetical protein